jgi:predicted RNase H-like nuclease
VYELHPEVSFAVLLGTPALAPKTSRAASSPTHGMVERRRGLEAKGISLDQFGGTAALRASVDDMLDAAVAAWTARRLARGQATSFPDPAPLDPSGRQVAIWA